MGFRIGFRVGPVSWSAPLTGRRRRPSYVEPYVGPGLAPGQVGEAQGPPGRSKRWIGIVALVALVLACPAWLLLGWLLGQLSP